MKRILVTNDDGVHSEGIRALADALKHLGEITVVAPIQEASAIGHALTLRRPLRVDVVHPGVFAVDGTPTDCVNVAITHVMNAVDPRFVMPTSGRRMKKQGFLKMAGLYFVNFFSIVFRGKPATKSYTDVR